MPKNCPNQTSDYWLIATNQQTFYIFLLLQISGQLQINTVNGAMSITFNRVIILWIDQKWLSIWRQWRLRNTGVKRFLFPQKHFSGSRRLDYTFISNSLQEAVVKTDILISLLGNHSLIFISVDISKQQKQSPRGVL